MTIEQLNVTKSGAYLAVALVTSEGTLVGRSLGSRFTRNSPMPETLARWETALPTTRLPSRLGSTRAEAFSPGAFSFLPPIYW